MNLVIRSSLSFMIALCMMAPAFASVVISGTRVVFDAKQGAATVQLTNKNTRPALVEAWIDDGNIHSTPDNSDAPFLVSPPLFRMEAGAGQSLRILYVGPKHGLPQDRESLFWLNVLEVPPKPTGAAAQQPHLQFAIRTRIKLFYRPDGLSPKRSNAAGRLVWTAVKSDGGLALEVKNPTPYYLTLAKVVLVANGHSYDAKTGMVAPFSSLTLKVSKFGKLPAIGSKVSYSTLDDFGVEIQHSGITRR